MAVDTALTAPEPAPRRLWVARVVMLVPIALLLLVALHPGLRGLVGDAWREMRTISPRLLGVIFLLKIGQALFSALIWRNALAAAWPASPLAFRFVLGVEQGQVAINTVLPARAGTFAMLGIFGYSIPGARAAKLGAVWVVQALASVIFSALTYLLLAIGLPQRSQQQGPLARISGLVSDRPWLAAGIAALVVTLGLVGAFRGRARIGQAWRQAREGLAILRSPMRYIRLLFLPALASHAFTCASTATLLHAFGIPVTVWTVALALGSNALAGAVRITPGGIGTSQAIDSVALRDYAAPGVVTAYSLSEIAITAVASATIAVVALLSVQGWHGTRRLVGHLHRGDLPMQRLGARRRRVLARLPRPRRRSSIR